VIAESIGMAKFYQGNLKKLKNTLDKEAHFSKTKVVDNRTEYVSGTLNNTKLK